MKLEKHFGLINNDDYSRNKTDMEFTSNTAKDRSEELTNHA